MAGARAPAKAERRLIDNGQIGPPPTTLST